MVIRLCYAILGNFSSEKLKHRKAKRGMSEQIVEVQNRLHLGKLEKLGRDFLKIYLHLCEMTFLMLGNQSCFSQ